MSFQVPVISNAGPLIALGKLDCLELLDNLFIMVQMPTAVYNEVVQQGIARGEPDAYLVEQFWQQKKWPVVQPDSAWMGSLKFQAVLEAGESEVLALAMAAARAHPVVLMDDQVARAEARRLGIHALGTLGIFIQAYRQRRISLAIVKQLIDQVIQHPDIWISETLCRQVLASLH